MMTRPEHKKSINLPAIGVLISVAGVLLTVIAHYAGARDFQRFLFSLLLNFTFFVSIGLGALCWVTLHHLTRAGWSVSIRRLSEAIGVSVIPFALVGIIILAFAPYVYEWAQAKIAFMDPIIREKSAYLNRIFFTVRYILYFTIWISIARFFFANSLRQDTSGDPTITLRMERFSPLAMILLAFSITFFAFDFLMSLDPHWFSTIFGVYYFSGCLVGFFSCLALAAVLSQKSPRAKGQITVEHLHDIGKFIFGFIVFWAYIAFSQYMLIWYANLPEETIWIERRQQGQWMTLTYALLVGHFVIPFLALMSRWPKRRPILLAIAAIWILLMHYLDLYWLILPEYTRIAHDAAKTVLNFAPTDLTLLLATAGLFLAALALPLHRSSLTPDRDPRLAESISFENV